MKPTISALQLFELEKFIEEMTAILPEISKHNQLAAKIKKQKYDVLIKEGFTEDQAIQIVIANGTEFLM